MSLVTVHARCEEAQGVVSLDLRALPGQAPLPGFAAGAHIDVEVPQDGGPPLLRQYSLCNSPADRGRYLIGVGRDPASRGGSTTLCQRVQVGDTLRIGVPRNNFMLDEQAEDSVLIAGGIGITPLLAMAHRLSELGRRWTLYLCARTPERAAFLQVAQQLPGVVIPVFDGVPGCRSLDLADLVRRTPASTQLYCCGPEPMLRSFQQASVARDPATVHVEWFRPPADAAPAAQGDQAFQVVLQRSGRSLQVPIGMPILDVLLAAGVEVPYSCRDGVCGTCETRVLAGRPDHRDTVLLGADANAQDRLMVCVSRCAGDSLTLDL